MRLYEDDEVGILGHFSISRYQIHRFRYGLCNQDSVKRIGVVKWKAGDLGRVFGRNGKLVKTTRIQVCDEFVRIGFELA